MKYKVTMIVKDLLKGDDAFTNIEEVKQAIKVTLKDHYLKAIEIEVEEVKDVPKS